MHRCQKDATAAKPSDLHLEGRFLPCITKSWHIRDGFKSFTDSAGAGPLSSEPPCFSCYPSSPKFTAAEWDAWIDQFHASGLPQSTFCEREGLTRFVFARHYRRSDKFAGTRRAPRSTNKKRDENASAFRPVQQKTTAKLEQSGGGDVVLRIGQDVSLQCSASVGIEAIIRLAREARP